MQLKVIYVPRDIIKEFIIEFYKGETQGYNGVMALILRL